MRLRRSAFPSVAIAAVASAPTLAACGGSDSSSNGSKGGSGGSQPSTSGVADTHASPDQQKGGKLKLSSAEGFEPLDPGQSYFQEDYMVVYATQRMLMSFKPEDPNNAAP